MYPLELGMWRKKSSLLVRVVTLELAVKCLLRVSFCIEINPKD